MIKYKNQYRFKNNICYIEMLYKQEKKENLNILKNLDIIFKY